MVTQESTTITCLCGARTTMDNEEAQLAGWFVLWGIAKMAVCPTCWNSAEKGEK